MKNKLYYPDFDRHKNLSKLYPDLLEIYKQPIAFWYGRDNKKPRKFFKFNFFWFFIR